MSPYPAATEAHAATAHALQQEKPPRRETRAPQLESSPHLPPQEKSPHNDEDPAQPKINKYIILKKK